MNNVPISGPRFPPASPAGGDPAADRRGRATGSPRTGRRPGDARTRDQILAAARASFAELGYNRTTIRGVAGRAGVDPALVHYFFGAKDQLFGAALELGRDPAQIADQVLAGDLLGIGERLVRTVLAAWDDPESGPALLALIRGAASHEQSATLLREYLGREVLGRIAAILPGPDPDLRASLAGTQLVGLAMARYVVQVPAVATAEPATLVRWIGPILQRYLTGPAPTTAP